MPQFLVRPVDVAADSSTATLRDDEARHLIQVLRARPGDAVEVFDGHGRRWTGVIAGIDPGTVRVHSLQRLPDNEPVLDIELIQGLPKGERWEWILEKGTELGVTRFRPIYSDHSVARLSDKRATERQLRWRRIALASAKQCERGRIPSVDPLVGLPSALADLGPPTPGEARIALLERLPSSSLSRSLSTPPALVRLAVGPEGGWSAADREALASAGFSPYSLGPRILRTDTAGLAGVVMVLSWWGGLEAFLPG